MSGSGGFRSEAITKPARRRHVKTCRAEDLFPEGRPGAPAAPGESQGAPGDGPPAGNVREKAPLDLKRVLDVTVALAALLAACPLMLFIAAAIKLVSRGPVLFRQKRVGLRGAVFTMLKFRTMEAATDPSVHREYVTELFSNKKRMAKIDDRHRLIPAGKLLRRTFLDELPQLFNVLRGEMSIIGPRPAIPYETKAYKDWHMERFSALPGMTGLWQVSGKNRLSFDDMVRLDIRYARTRSIWTDIGILLKTPWAIACEIKNSPNTV
jgi:lipopolysaccharide/colanic/teichoic acid biosynthesis glycosyltransferase